MSFFTGIQIIGHLRAATGLGESARSSMRAAHQAGIPYHATEVPLYFETGSEEEEIHANLGVSADYMVNLIHLNGDDLITNMPSLISDLQGKYNIGYWVWETPRWPAMWWPATQFVHEIWTPSRFSQSALKGNASVPVFRIPHNIEIRVPDGIGRQELGLPTRGFLFMGMLDMVSLAERKNPLGALEAYQRAFGSQPNGVYFILKVNRGTFRPDVMKAIERHADNNPSIILKEGYLDRPFLNALINSCDCFVSLHRAEGFGLPLAEAMYTGKPVIATGWSGNMDYMNARNSFPVRYCLKELEKDLPPFGKGSIWAEPDYEHAAHLMQQIVREDSLSKQVGKVARADIRREFSPRKIGKLMQEQLKSIGQVEGNN
jgi:glycosyltransferase involved in cell wall biosynthesis